MAAPVYVTNGGLVGIGTTALTTTTTWPAVAANDIAFLIVHDDNHSVLSVPGDWTACGAQVDSSLSPSARVWWKRLDGTESGTVTLTRGTAALNEWFGGTIATYSGCITSGTPFEGYATAQGTTVTMNGPAITTTGPDRLAVLFWCQGDNLTSTVPAGYTQNFELLDAAGNDGGQDGDSQTVATATTVGAVTRTIASANPSITFGLALLPAAASFPPLPSVPPAIMHFLAR
jgi:hypothetical protein